MTDPTHQHRVVVPRHPMSSPEALNIILGFWVSDIMGVFMLS